MSTNSATPELMQSLASALEDMAGEAELRGSVGAELCRQFGYWYAATGAAGGAAGAAGWARAWATSLAERAELLDQYEVIALLGSAAAGGAGSGLGMARSWALGSAELEFSNWYAEVQARMTAERVRREQVALGEALAARFREPSEVLLAPEDLITALQSLGPVALAAFFEDLGAKGVYDILAFGYYDPMFGPGWEFDDAFAVSLERAWDDLPDGFRLPLFERAPWEMLFTVAARGDFTGSFLGMLAAKMASQGFVPYVSYAGGWYYPDAMVRLAELIAGDAEARVALVTSPLLYRRWNEPFARFDEWVLDVGAAELPRLGDDQFIELIDAVLLREGAGRTVDNDALAQLLIGHALDRSLAPTAEGYVLAVLLHVQAHDGVPMALEPAFAEEIALFMPSLIAVTDGSPNDEVAGFVHPATGDVLEVDDALLSAALANTMRNEEARTALLEGLTAYFSLRAAELELVASNELFNRSLALADDMGSMTGLLITAINAADIKHATDRDEAFAAIVGMADTIIGIIPGPGGALVDGLADGIKKDLIKNAVNTAYTELIDRGLAQFDSSYEGAARVGADEFRDVLSGEMEELLMLALVDAHVGLGTSVDDFLGTSTAQGVDPGFWDADSGFLTEDINQRLAYNQWYEWASHEYPEIVAAIVVYITELQQELPVWAD